MWKNTVDLDRPQMTILRKHIACWVHKATNTHSKYVIPTAFPQQQWLQERASLLRHTYIACLVKSDGGNLIRAPLDGGSPVTRPLPAQQHTTQ